MSVARTFRALELYDVLANLVPGAVFLLVVGAVIRIESYLQIQSGTIAAGIFLVLSLVLGHVILAFASFLDGTPSLFSDVIKSARGDEVEDIPISVTHVEERLWPLIRRKFDLPPDYDAYGRIFRLVISYIETTPATRALRFQALHSFHRSMWGIWFLVIPLALLSLLMDCMGFLDTRGWVAVGLVVLAGIIGILVFESRKSHYNELFVKYTIVDFYTDQVEEGTQHGNTPRFHR